MARSALADNAGGRSGGCPEVEARASGTDISMKRAGWKCSFSLVLVLGAVLLAAGSVSAQQASPPGAAASSTLPLTLAAFLVTPDPAPSVNEKLAQLDQRVTAAQSSADNAWMLVSAALLLMMTGPGLALFYGGRVRREKTLAVIVPSFP